jgi:hypothetical protein
MFGGTCKEHVGVKNLLSIDTTNKHSLQENVGFLTQKAAGHDTCVR